MSEYDIFLFAWTNKFHIESWLIVVFFWDQELRRTFLVTFWSLFTLKNKLIVASYGIYVAFIWIVNIWFGKPLREPPDKCRGCFFWLILFQVSYFKASTSLHQDCATLCEGDFVCLWISIFRIIKTIVGLACNVIFAGISATGFEIAAAFLKSFQLAIEIFLSSKLIVESFLERSTFVLPVGFRLDKSSFTSGCYCFKASFVSPDNYIVLFEGDMLNLRKRGSRYSQSKYFDRGRHADKRGRSRRLYHRVRRCARLSGRLRLCQRARLLHRCYADIRTVVIVGARGFGIAIGLPAHVGTPGFEALPGYASGAAIVVMKAYGFILAIACVPRVHCFTVAKRNTGAALAEPLRALSVSRTCL